MRVSYSRREPRAFSHQPASRSKKTWQDDPAAFDTELGTSAAVFLNGPSVSTMFDPETPEEENMLIVIDTHQDWFVASTETMIAQNKPLVSFLSHSSFKETVLSDEYSAGGHYLRLIARTILGEDDSRVAKLCHI